MPEPAGQANDQEDARLIGGIFNKLEIQAARERGQITIEPFRPELLQTSSVDVTVGEWYWVFQEPPEGFINPYDPDMIKRCFKGPYQGMRASEWAAKRKREPLVGIAPDQKIIEVRPGERILAHTHEFIGIRNGGTTKMQAKSTIGRWGLVVCYDAGWGDEGYDNRWTMEIDNNNGKSDFLIVVGQPIAQITFFKMRSSGESYSQHGHYQTTGSVVDMMAEWTPESMLPRTFEVKEFLPQP